MVVLRKQQTSAQDVVCGFAGEIRKQVESG
jgi:hypothetical protein